MPIDPPFAPSLFPKQAPLKPALLSRNSFEAAAAAQHAFQQHLGKDQTWDTTIERIVKGIVSIRASAVRAFDTEASGDYTATGFVVDKERGIILSNRHVVNPAPITATAVFVNYEEAPLRPIYRDPVHDFGFFQYDPEKIRFLDVEEIELRPDLAKVGLSIKVVGNDSGEKLSILGSTLARLDRGAPRYGDDLYEDFNTFYYQAATGTSGGSSGSPVLNISGQAIALNAGGSKRSASSFYLPLDRVVRALNCLRNGLPITRGTLQTEFVHRSYDELRRLGLSPESEASCRSWNPSSTGLLTVARVLPGGPAHGRLEPGDILIACNDVILDSFVPLFDIIDSNINSSVRLSLYRGTEAFECSVVVGDLHAITPDRFAEVGGAIFHDLSYQQARSYGMPVKDQGVYVALSGMLNWSSLTRNYLLTSFAGRPTPNLDAFLEILKTVPDSARVPSRTKDLGASRETVGVVTVDRHFNQEHLFVRNDKTGVWDRQKLLPATAEPCASASSTEEDVVEEEDDEEEDDDPLTPLRESLIYVNVRLPFSVNGYSSSNAYYGVGTLLSLENDFPIIAVDRAAVPSEVVDVRLTIQHHYVTGRVIAMDRLAYLTFNLADLPKGVKLRTAEFDADARLKIKDEVTVVGLTSSQSFVEKSTTVSQLGDVGTTKCNPPRFRLINVEGISLADSVSCDGGLIAQKHTEKYDDPAGGEAKERGVFKIVALWVNASSQNSSDADIFWKTGMVYSVYIKSVVDSIRRSVAQAHTSPSLSTVDALKAELPKSRTFNVETGVVSLTVATSLGLRASRIKQFTKLSKTLLNTSNVKFVNVLEKFSHADSEVNEANDLVSGDILLEIDGVPVVRLLDLELQLQDLSKDSFQFTILRGGAEKTITIRPLPDMSSGLVAPKIVQWSGAYLHETFSEAIEQVAHNTKLVPLSRGVYVGSVSYGAPALNNIRPAQWIIEIDDVMVDSIDRFLQVVREKQKWSDGQFVRVKLVNRKDVTSVVSVQVNERYWPSRCLIKRPDGLWWQEDL
ncbi:hypothetical protein BZA70DRAFT_241264 [Myxozyma melibiosi]|uniref:PDZ domain-containing protein n=1 Tax=Myxozyma melibiosi TaxID=54550 RepID=A0ABR1F0L2_9ASCO